MSVIWIFFGLLLLAGMLFVALPMFVSKKGVSLSEEGATSINERQSANVALYREREAELTSRFELGEITQEAKESLLKELQQQLLSDASGQQETTNPYSYNGQWLLWLCLVLIPAVAVGWYQWQGFLPELSIRDSYTGVMQGKVATATLKDQLQDRVAERIDNSQLWYLLGQANSAEGDYPKAVEAYRQVLALGDDSPRVLSEYAQVLFAANGNRMSPEVESAAGQALAKDPQNRSALGLMGIAAFQVGEYEAAIEYWQRLRGTLAAGSPEMLSIVAGIERARSLLAAEPGNVGITAGVDGFQAGQNENMQVEEKPANVVVANISLDSKVQASPDETVYVFIRAWQGSPMPLVVKRLKVADLPVSLSLSDHDAMVQGTQLADTPKLQVVARLSRKGTPKPQPGDWQAGSEAIDSQTLPATVDLLINQQL